MQPLRARGLFTRRVDDALPRDAVHTDAVRADLRHVRPAAHGRKARAVRHVVAHDRDGAVRAQAEHIHVARLHADHIVKLLAEHAQHVRADVAAARLLADVGVHAAPALITLFLLLHHIYAAPRGQPCDHLAAGALAQVHAVFRHLRKTQLRQRARRAQAQRQKQAKSRHPFHSFFLPFPPFSYTDGIYREFLPGFAQIRFSMERQSVV